MTEPDLRVPLAVGDPAPPFTARSSHGEEISLADLAGTPVLLFFYPWAFSGICTGELQTLRDRYDELAATGVRLFAVSVDSMFALRVFGETEQLPYELLSDFWPHGQIADAYGVFEPDAGCSVRASFLLDAGGVVRWSVVQGIGEARDIDAHLAAARELASSPGGEPAAGFGAPDSH